MELRVDFQSRDDWELWRQENATHFNRWRQSILRSVQEFGYVEPFTERYVEPASIKIAETNLRETVSNGEFNSRKRALLLEFDCLCRSYPRLAAKTARIFAPEALSRTALVFRGRYPYFLGTEYLPEQAARDRYFPVMHADLTDLFLQSEMFDLIYTQDVLEHVPALEKSIHEMARVLKPGGVLISTFPFAAGREVGEIAARIDNGNLVHLRPPEYHGDPLDAKGVLVFQIPAWNVLDMCRAAGLSDARMVLHASATHGIVTNDMVGVLVLSAMKTQQERTIRKWIWPAERINQLVGVLGVPRSGTTMFSAVLDAHPDIVSIYEPWNATKSNVNEKVTLKTLLSQAESQNKSAHTLVIKETTMDPAYSLLVATLLNEARPPLSQHLLILLRNPFHCFLSEIEGRQRWWGEADLEPNAAVFNKWAERTLASYTQLLKLAAKHPSSLVFYESCVSDPHRTFAIVMQQLGLSFQSDQLNISTNADLKKIRGDMSLINDARDVTDDSLSKRHADFARVRGQFSMSGRFQKIQIISSLFEENQCKRVIELSSAESHAFVEPFQAILRS